MIRIWESVWLLSAYDEKGHDMGIKIDKNDHPILSPSEFEETKNCLAMLSSLLNNQ